MSDEISAKPLFDTFKDRGDPQAFADKLNISLARLLDWRKRGIPFKMIRPVAAAMGLQSADQYYELASGGTRDRKARSNHDKPVAHLSDGDKLLVLINAFLQTDDEGKHELLEAVTAVQGSNGVSIRNRSRRDKSR